MDFGLLFRRRRAMASEEDSSRKKRGAENQITKDNWEADDDPIDPQVSVRPRPPARRAVHLCAAARRWCTLSLLTTGWCRCRDVVGLAQQAGPFKEAAEDELKKRRIVKARRSGTGESARRK